MESAEGTQRPTKAQTRNTLEDRLRHYTDIDPFCANTGLPVIVCVEEAVIWPRVSIIILNWNGWRDTIECLESVYHVTYANYDVVVVDNGSEDESIEKLRDYCEGNLRVESARCEYSHDNKPITLTEYTEEQARDGKQIGKSPPDSPSQSRLILIENQSNYGFSGGNNIGIMFALKALGPDYVLLLNNDVIVGPAFLSRLVEVSESDAKIGIAGPRIYNYSHVDKIAFAGGRINLWLGQSHHVGLNETDEGKHSKVAEVDYIEGSCLLVKTKVVEDVGMFDSAYVSYWEDTDWCIRANRAGYKVVYVPTAQIWHKESSTSAGPIKVYYFTRNRFLFMKKHASALQITSFMIAYFAIVIWYRIFVFLFYYRRPNLLKPFFRAIKDGISEICKRRGT